MSKRSISDYMNHHQGRSISATQAAGVIAWEKLTHDIEQLRQQRDVLKASGLEDAAKRVQQLINEAEINRRRLEDRLNEERRIMAASILVAFAACDIATTAADEFDECMRKYSHGSADKVNAFSTSIREQATSFNKLVQAIDEAEHLPLSLLYADMAEEIVDAALEMARETVARYMDTPKGRRYV